MRLVDPVHRAAHRGRSRSRARSTAGSLSRGNHRQIGRRASSFPQALELGYAGRLEQELQGLLEVDLNAADIAARSGHFMSAEGSDDVARRQRATGPGAGVAARHDHVESQRAPFHRRDELSRAEQRAFVAHSDLYETGGQSRRASKTAGRPAGAGHSTCRASLSAPNGFPPR